MSELVTRRPHHNLHATGAHLLPNELLLDIFTRGLDAQWDAEQPLWEQQAVGFLARITSVCSTWRLIAISYPLIWRRITLINRKTCRYDCVSHRLRTFLARSKNVTLDIHIDFSYFKPMETQRSRLADILFRHMQRFRKLSLKFHGYSGGRDSGLLIELGGPLVDLKELRIEGTMVKLLSSKLHFSTIGPNNMSFLEHLHLEVSHTLSVGPSDGFACIRTDRLRLLTVHCSDQSWFLEIIRFVARCANVEQLQLSLWFPEELTHIDPFTLDKVVSYSDYCATPYTLIQVMSMPALESLSLGEAFMEDDTDIEDPLVGPHFPCLRSLSFAGYAFRDDDALPLHKLLCANPTLEEIETEGCDDNDVVLLALLGSPDEYGVSAPGLESVHNMVQKPVDGQQRAAPNLRKLTFTEQRFHHAVERQTQAFQLAHILHRWALVHVLVDSWGIRGRQIAETHLLTRHFTRRFTLVENTLEDWMPP